MHPRDQLDAYRQAMGADAVRRQLAADNRDEYGHCKECGVGIGANHYKRCAFAAGRKLAERVA